MTAAHLPTPPVCTGSQPLSSTAETADMNPEATHRFLRGPTKSLLDCLSVPVEHFSDPCCVGSHLQHPLSRVLPTRITSSLSTLFAQHALSRLADAHRETPCVGRSYGQHAAPVTFGYKAAVWLSSIADTADRLPDLRAQVLVVSFGGPVGTLASLGDAGPRVLEGL